MLILIEQAQKLRGSVPGSSSLSFEELLLDFFACVSQCLFPINNFPKISVTLLFFQFCLFGMLVPDDH